MTIVRLAEELETSPATLLRLIAESRLPIEDFFITTRSEYLSGQGEELLRWLLLKQTQTAFTDELFNLRSKLRQRTEETMELHKQIDYYLDYILTLERESIEKKSKKIRKPYTQQAHDQKQKEDT